MGKDFKTLVVERQMADTEAMIELARRLGLNKTVRNLQVTLDGLMKQAQALAG